MKEKATSPWHLKRLYWTSVTNLQRCCLRVTNWRQQKNGSKHSIAIQVWRAKNKKQKQKRAKKRAKKKKLFAPKTAAAACAGDKKGGKDHYPQSAQHYRMDEHLWRPTNFSAPFDVYFRGDGVVCKMLSGFYDMFVMFNCEERSEFTISVSPGMQPSDYVTLGRTLTHELVTCGCFPAQLACASFHQALFGTVSNKCLLDSFLVFLPEKEREKMFLHLDGTKPFPLEEIIDIVEDFKETTMPSPAKLWELLLKVATTEFTNKPFLPLLELRGGMGDFRNGTTKELDSLYDVLPETDERSPSFEPCPSQSTRKKVYRWLKRYARNLESKMTVKFVRF